MSKFDHLSVPLKKKRLELLKRFLSSSVVHMKTRLHQIILSGEEVTGYIIEEQLKRGLYFIKHDGSMMNYKKQAFLQLRNAKLTVFLEPKEGYFPQCVIRMNYPSFMLLFKLNKFLPDLKISKVEYSNDLFFENRALIRQHFLTLRKYLYFPNRGYAVIHGSPYAKRTNITYDAGSIIMYERGKDEKKVDKRYWNYSDLDRIRIEVRCKHLGQLNNFLSDPQFEHRIENKFYFKRFNGACLPREWERYYTKDKHKYRESFHNEYMSLKREYANLSQHVEDVPELEDLRLKILRNAKKFDRKWMQQYSIMSKAKYSYTDL